MKSLKSINETLKELILGIILFGVLFQVVLIWFTENKLYFTSGLWIGVLLSVFMAVHMNYSIQNTVDLPEQDAPGYYRKLYVIRVGIVLLVLGAAVLLKLGNVMALFLGLFTLKTGVYLQPVLHKILEKIQKKGR